MCSSSYAWVLSGIFEDGLLSMTPEVLPDCTHRLGFVQTVKMNARGSSYQKILALMSGILNASFYRFCNIAGNRRKYFMNIPANLCPAGQAHFALRHAA
jgi:hypothetical protein